MKSLILTEKPSVAMDYAKALGNCARHDGYLEHDKYVITWAVGHLVTLKMPEDYDPALKTWAFEKLPIIPEMFDYKILDKTKNQFFNIQKLLKRSDIESILIGTDAGREGEVIARLILNQIGIMNKTVFRLWTSQALTEPVIRDLLRDPEPAENYDRLWDAGICRQKADWLVGINATRAATAKFGSGEMFSIGRVQTAVLALIVDRRREIENFKPEKYWIVEALFKNEKGSWLGKWIKDNESIIKAKDQAEAIVLRIKDKTGLVDKVEKEQKKQAPPQLYSLTELQKDANKLYGFTAKKTLDLAQALYEEHKCLSYPRTDSRVMGSKNLDVAKKKIDLLQKDYPDIFKDLVPGLVSLENKRVFDDEKLTDHHALIPFQAVPAAAKEDEKKIYFMVLKRFAAVFHADYEYEQTIIWTAVQDDLFKTTGKITLKEGWKKLYQEKSEEDTEEPDEKLPALQQGDAGQVLKVNLKEEQTKPKPDYTEATLLTDMTNPAKYVSDAEMKRLFKGDIGLGTQATRAAIIETLIERSYVERKVKKLIAMEKGCFLIDNIRKYQTISILAFPEHTGKWELELERIAQGEERSDFLDDIKAFVRTIIEELKKSTTQYQKPKNILGKCPLCGLDVVETPKAYGCSGYKEKGCNFKIWKTIAGKNISEKTAETLLSTKKSKKLKGFKSKAGKNFEAALYIDDQGNVKFQF
ncbi:MAG: type IA DNA topoisomerase [Desulfobacteraceae bacterium]|nr:MAG: type IA DNA topoisomerase [Desulfobacteraceae bacterium]